ncbi:MAG: LysR family transcriptional regulator [Thermodesulfobacteriota bacterium]|nr:LysR family transcriptional regulator [Thermodesulfobacteriota bacterium]
MNLELLKTFIAVVKHNSFSKASEEVFLTQPAVTKQIKILEKEYKTKLFEREKNKLFLTDDGKVFLNYAHRILGLYNESHIVINEQKGQVKGTLIMGTNLTLGIYVLPRLVKLFGDMHPDIKFEMYLDNTDHVIKAIQKRDVSFGFIGKISDDATIVNHLFYKDRLKVVISPKYGLKKRVVSWKELEKIPFISREKGSDIRGTYEDWFKDRPVELTLIMELNNTEAIKFSVQCRLGFSILPWCTIEQEVRWGLLQTLSVPHFDPIQQFYISYYKGRKFSRHEQKFLEYLFNLVEKGELSIPSF